MGLLAAARAAAAEGRNRIQTEKTLLHLEKNVDTNLSVKFDSIDNTSEDIPEYLKNTAEEEKLMNEDTLVSSKIDEKNDYSALNFESIKNRDNDERLVCSPDIDSPSPVNISKLIRKYSCPDIGMLRVGEYSPNNPELAGDGRALPGGDAFLGFGLYEEKRKKLLKKRQIEYREYLAKQNQINLLKKQNVTRVSPGRNLILDHEKRGFSNDNLSNQYEYLKSKNYDMVPRRPSSVGVQTDPDELALMTYDRRLSNTTVTRAERELSPRPSLNGDTNSSEWRMLVEKVNIGTQNNLIVPPSIAGNKKYLENMEITPSIMGTKKFNDIRNVRKNNYTSNEYPDADDIIYRKDSPRARLLQDLRHTYMPSLFDADAIKNRNLKIEEEAVIKRTNYQIELKKQIEEQQKIREEKKAKEKLLEEAETRRLEEQLKMLKLTQENEMMKQKMLSLKIQNDNREFNEKRSKLHTDIENEKRNLKNVKINRNTESRSSKVPYSISTSRENEDKRKSNDTNYTYGFSSSPHASNDPDIDLLSYNVKRNNPYVGQDQSRHRLPYSSNLPDNSPFAQSIPVKNYNSNDVQPVSFSKDRFSHESRTINPKPKENVDLVRRSTRPNYEPAFLSKKITDMIDLSNLKKDESTFNDSLPIPVLREPEKRNIKKTDTVDKTVDHTSDAMKQLEHKWQVPAVQKNILRNNLSEDGKQENILTQLGSIRRQLQLEQLKLDQSQFFSKQLIK